MLKAQLAQALQLPMNTRAELGMLLLRDLEAEEPAELAAGSSSTLGVMGPMSAADAKRAAGIECDQLVAGLRAKLAAAR